MKKRIELTPKLSADLAVQYLEELFPGIKDVEIEAISHSLNWYVTLSFPGNVALVEEGSPLPRKYKLIEIDYKRAKAVSMR